MSTPELLASWPRRYFTPGGGDAHLFYKIHGTFHGSPNVSYARHRCGGVPEGCDLQLFTRDSQPNVLDFGLDDSWIGTEFRRTNGALERKVAATDQCLVLRGVISDPANLDYFRDAV